MQMFETLMLRQTDDERHRRRRRARFRSSSAADTDLLDRLRPCLGEQRGQLRPHSAHDALTPLRDSTPEEVPADHALGATPRAAAGDERPVARGDHVEHALREPLASRCGCGYTQSRSPTATPSRASRRRTWWGGGTDARARYGRRWPRGRPGRTAPAATSSGHQSERLGGTWIPISGNSSRAAATSSRRSSMPTSHAHSGAASCGWRPRPVRQYSSEAAVAISAGSSP